MSKRQGHFCWSCERMRPNEGFSGRGHARHFCRECQKLGTEELTFRQAVRDMDGMIQWETGRVKGKQRSNFANFLHHANERVRRYAEGVAARAATVHVDDDCFASPGSLAPQSRELCADARGNKAYAAYLSGR